MTSSPGRKQTRNKARRVSTKPEQRGTDSKLLSMCDQYGAQLRRYEIELSAVDNHDPVKRMLFNHNIRLERRIAGAKATTVAGIAAKLRVAHLAQCMFVREYENGPADDASEYHCVIWNLLADAERILKRAAV